MSSTLRSSQSTPTFDPDTDTDADPDEIMGFAALPYN
jgi:hypothetical protein